MYDVGSRPDWAVHGRFFRMLPAVLDGVDEATLIVLSSVKSDDFLDSTSILLNLKRCWRGP